MKGCSSAVLAVLCVLLVVAGTHAAQLEIPGYVVSDLHLISQESKADWSTAWTGPIQAATVLAWYAEHGYPAFMSDFNGDGTIDELDTTDLADRLGKGPMEAESEHNSRDVRLVLGLAQYVADHYPDEFELKIYDKGFQAEYAAETGASFDPEDVDGIELVLQPDEPSIEAYELELLSGEGVIVGLETEQESNLYLAGRSFLYEKTSSGHAPLDFTWAEEDHWLPEHQGRVLETVGRMDPLFDLEFDGRWTLVEFMLALSPTNVLIGEGGPEECPEDALAYDVIVTHLGRNGRVRVEECVTREAGVDTYSYTVTNIDFLQDGCGLCLFAIPRPASMPTVGHSEDAPWLYSLYPDRWVWRLPLGHCGILPGAAATFSVAVPGPTTDVSVLGAAAGCPQPVPDDEGSMLLMAFPIRTTGPGGPDEACPDLVVRHVEHRCQCDPVDNVCILTVWADVVNIGAGPATNAFEVVLRSLDHPPASIAETYTPPPEFGPGDIWSVELMISFPMGGEMCPTGYEVYVDPPFVPNGFVEECDEGNNGYENSIDCYCEERGACCFADGSCAEVLQSVCIAQGGSEFHAGVPCVDVECSPPEDVCPDLIVEITQLYCRNVGAVAPLYEVTIEALVTNIGTETITDSIWVEAESPCGGDTDIIHTNLDPGDTDTAEFTLTCTANQPGCHAVTVTVDYPNFITECDEDNNEDEGTFCCR